MDYKLSRRTFLKATAGIMVGGFISKYTKEKSYIDVYAKEWEIVDLSENFEYAYRIVGDAFDPRVNFKNNVKKLLGGMMPEYEEYVDDILEGSLKGELVLKIIKRYGMSEVYGEISDFFEIFNELSEYDRTFEASQIDTYLKTVDMSDDRLGSLVRSGHLNVAEPYIPQETNRMVSLLREERDAKDSETLREIYRKQKEHLPHLRLLFDHAHKKGEEISFPKYRCVIGDNYSVEVGVLMVFLRLLGICRDATEYLYPMKELSELGLKIVDTQEKTIEQNLKTLEF